VREKKVTKLSSPESTVPNTMPDPELLHRVVVWDADNECQIVLLTNLLEFGATTIAAIYKERWKTELLRNNLPLALL